MRSAAKDPIIEKFLGAISPLRKHIEEIYLFGSRSRNDWRPDSDYDILIVLEKKDRKLIDSFYDVVMDILFDTGRLISLKIFTTSEFNRFKSIPSRFIENVMKEGINLGQDD
ncbi:MAG: nucleotidyltransferase domain-containing protein [Spirochaetota bacterium]